MSKQIDPFLNPGNIQNIEAIDQLDLPIMQKHHVRILAHCLYILRIISAEGRTNLSEENLLREWCDSHSKKFNDKKFSDLFFEQLKLTAKKLKTFSRKIGKNIEDLDIDDLVLLVEQS